MKEVGNLRAAAARAAAAAFAAWALAASAVAGAQALQTASLADLSIEELANIEITSVSRRAEPLSEAAASVYVITAEQIRRSGARTLPEALRLAPNLQVARIDATQYAISARGFNNSIGNKLLVQIDGRTIYTPLFSGVFWDQQDVMLQDVERIEVLSGPGATLWGANAVNGVINVITRAAADTQGVLFSAGAGNEDIATAFRYGGQMEGGHYRVYGKALRRSDTFSVDPAALPDGQDRAQAGFRADWSGARDRFTLQGDAYSGRSDDRGTLAGFVIGPIETNGANLLGRWNRSLADGSELQVQSYVDHSEREDHALFQPTSDIFDLELQHSLRLGSHAIVWGGGYRYGHDNVDDGLLSGFRPRSSSQDWENVFAQDEYRLADSVTLTGGLKFERNDYTGWEYLPSIRLAWKPADSALVWAAVSRAVRAPSRFDRDITVPIFPGFSLGGPHFEAEVADVYELGYRGQASGRLNYSATLFLHDWERLRSGTPPPLMIENRIQGSVYGLESWATWQATSSWQLSGGLTLLREELTLEPGSTDPVGVRNVTLANDPQFQWSLRSAVDLSDRQQFDVTVRTVGGLSVAPVPQYTAVDARYAWKVRRDTEVSLTLQNLFDPSHPEFRTSAAVPNEIERSLFIAVRWEQ
jgi:iron complex outermembrane receptor protein